MVADTNIMLKHLWQTYQTAYSEHSQDEMKHLDRLLQRILTVIRCASTEEINFSSDMRSVCSLLAQQFLTGVSDICRSSVDDDVSPLEVYLLHAGRGAMLLKVINTLGVEGLSCGHEFSSLLLRLLPLCYQFSEKDENQSDQGMKLHSMDDCFMHIPLASLSRKQNRTHSTPFGSTMSSPRNQTGYRGQHKSRRRSLTSETSTSDSSDCDVPNPLHSMLPSYRANFTQDHIGLVPGILSTNKEDSDGFVDNDDIELWDNDIIDMSPLQLCVTSLDIITCLNKNNRTSHSHNMLSLTTIIDSLLLFIVDLMEDSKDDNMDGWKKNDVLTLVRFSVRAVISVLSTLLIQSNEGLRCNVEVFLKKLLHIAHQSLNQLGVDQIDINYAFLCCDILEGVWLLMYMLFESIPVNHPNMKAALFILKSVEAANGLELLQKTITLCENYIELNDNSNSTILSNYLCLLLDSITKVMKSVKKAKLNFMHNQKCCRMSHRNCGFSQFVHHHHDILGTSLSVMTERCMMSDGYGSNEQITKQITTQETQFGTTEQTAREKEECVISILGQFILTTLKTCSSKLVMCKVLGSLDEAGLCCCMPPGLVVNDLTQNLQQRSTLMRDAVLKTLTKCLMEYSSGSQNAQDYTKDICDICCDVSLQTHNNQANNNDTHGQTAITQNPVDHASDSAISSSESGIHQPVSICYKWRCLRQFLPLVKHSSSTISVQVMQHLLRFVAQGSILFKQELFYCVFLPLLRTISDKIITPDNFPATSALSSGSIIQYYLLAMPMLLNSKVTHELFLNHGGLEQLCSLAHEASLRKCILQVFQVIIVQEGIVLKQKQQSRAPSIQEEVDLEDESRSRSAVIDMFVDMVYNGHTDIELIKEREHRKCSTYLLALRSKTAKSEDTLPYTDYRTLLEPNHLLQQKVSPRAEKIIAESVGDGSSTDEFTGFTFSACGPRRSVHHKEEFTMPHTMEELFMLVDLWQACAQLIPQSDAFLQRFLVCAGPHRAYKVLLSVLNMICISDMELTERCNSSHGNQSDWSRVDCWMAILQSTLLTCLSCADLGVTWDQQELRSDQLMAILKREITQSKTLSGPLFKCLCDSLINCATYTTTDDIVQQHTFNVMHVHIEDDVDDSDFSEMSGECTTSLDSDLGHTDHGYEADTEYTEEENNNDDTIIGLSSSAHNRSQILMYPELYQTVLHILIDYHSRDNNEGILAHVLTRIIALLRQRPHMANTLAGQKLMPSLLVGFQQVLKKFNDGAMEAQLLLDLFLLLSHHGITATDLYRFFSLFKDRDIPVEPLLQVGISMSEGIRFQPSYMLTFPEVTNTVDVESMATECDHNSRASGLSIDTVDLESVSSYSEQLRAHHRDNKLPSLCTNPSLISAIEIDLQPRLLWPESDNGFTLALWLCLEGGSAEEITRRKKMQKSRTINVSNSSDLSNNNGYMEHLPTDLHAAIKHNSVTRHWNKKCLHLATIGSKTEQLQIWVDPVIACLVFRLVSHSSGTELLLASGSIGHVLTWNSWQHLSIVVKQDSQNSTNTTTISTYVDGCIEGLCVLHHPSHDTESSGIIRNQMLLGHVMSVEEIATSSGAWKLGNVMLFRGCSYSLEHSFHMYCLGPDSLALPQCDGEDIQVDYKHYVSAKTVLKSNLGVDVFTGNREIYLQTIRENLVVTYSPQTVDSYNCYTVSTVSHAPRGIITQKSSFNPLIHQPNSKLVKLHANLTHVYHLNMKTALEDIGGVGTILFLFAKIVETSTSSHQQAQSLKLLFSLLNTSSLHSTHFMNMSGYSMLSKILTTSRCIKGMELLKVLLDATLTKSVLHYNTATERYSLHTNGQALIRNINIITEIFLDWRIWSQNSDEATIHVWATMFKVLENLLCKEHAAYQFNVKLLHSIYIVGRLLAICLERIQDAQICLPASICQSIVNIIHCMIGNPADRQVIQVICNVLLLLHPAAMTFIMHDTKQMYYVPKWVTGQKSPAEKWTLTPSRSASDINDCIAKPHQQCTPHQHSTPLNKKRCKSDGSGKSTATDKKHSFGSQLPSKPTDEVDRAVQQTYQPITEGHNSNDPIREKHVNINSPSAEKETGALTNTTPVDESCHDSSSSECGGSSAMPKSTVFTLGPVSQGPGDYTDDEALSDILDEDIENDNSAADSFLDDDLSCPPSGSESGSDIEHLSSIPSHPSPELSCHSQCISPDPIEEPGLVCLSSGLLELLSLVVVSTPTSHLRGVLDVVLKPEVLLVMANHPAPQIRTAVVKLLDAYLQRASPEQINRFLNKTKGFHLLACQLYQHYATCSLVESLMAIVIARPYILEEDINAHRLRDMTVLQRQAVLPLIAVLENSVYNASLAHNTIQVLMQLYMQVPCITDTMLEAGICQVLCNALMLINTMIDCLSPPSAETKTMIEDIQQFYGNVAEKCFSTPGSKYMRYIEDSLVLLHSFEKAESKKYGIDSIQVGHVRIMQGHVYRSMLDYVSSSLDNSLQGQVYPLRKAISNTVAKLFKSSKKTPPVTQSTFHSSHTIAHSFEHQDLELSASLLNSPMPVQSCPQLSNAFSNNNQSPHSSKPPSSSSLDTVDSQNGNVLGDLSNYTSPFTKTMSSPIIDDKAERRYSISTKEMLDRFKKLIVHAVDFLTLSPLRSGMMDSVDEKQRLSNLVSDDIEVVSAEQDFMRYSLEFLLKAIIIGIDKNYQKIKTVKNIMWQSKDVLQMQFCRLLIHMMSPSMELCQRLFVLDLICNDPKCKDVLKLTVHINSTGQRLIYYTYELLSQHLGKFETYQRHEAEDLQNILQSFGYVPIKLGTRVTPEMSARLHKHQKQYQADHEREQQQLYRKHVTLMQRFVNGLQSDNITGTAMSVTQTVVNAQNIQRKRFIEDVKQVMSEKLQVKKDWQQIIQQLTHERALWHCKESYPVSWQLDSTEGPGRMRKRLQRCHLDVDPRFLYKEQTRKLDAAYNSPPLCYLFEEDNQSSDSAALLYRLHTNEKIQYTVNCTSVTPSTETEGELLIGEHAVYFVGDQAIMDANYTQVLLGNKDQLWMNLPLEHVRRLHRCRYQLQDVALEMHLSNGKTCLLAFQTNQEREKTFSIFERLELPTLLRDETLATLLEHWLSGKITNFEYLMQLNNHSGRTYNDLMQYPIFPFVLKDYQSNVLDLNSENSFRNLSKPISVQNKHLEAKYIDTYKLLEQNYKEPLQSEFGEYRPKPFHYGSHYSNSGSVLHYLVRMPPFTQMFLKYQDNNFDLPDRTFHKMLTTWQLASNDSATDVKEMIPEFYFLPEFLMNAEGFNFGERQSGEQVDDIVLPPWCDHSYRLFTLIHRQALESSYVTANLPEWIDLIFGYKQSGQHAIDAINVFHPATYFGGSDFEAIEDSVERIALKTMIKTYGQTPKQLFKNKHPLRAVYNPPQGKQGAKSPTSLDNKQKKANSSLADRSALNSRRMSASYSVEGLMWGNYIGSPDQADPVMVWSEQHPATIHSLFALPSKKVFGLKHKSCLLVMHKNAVKEIESPYVSATDLLWAAIVSWGYADRIIRVKNTMHRPPTNWMNGPSHENISCCAVMPDWSLLFFGGTSGVISVFHTKFNKDKATSIQVLSHRRCLYGHGAAVTNMALCRAFSILVSASEDGTVIIWDLNRLCYVRSIRDHQARVKLVAVSDTLGDIVSVSDSGKTSCIFLHSVNASFMNRAECEVPVQCITYSNALEGRSVNVIAGGLKNGTIRLWSSWDLMIIRDISSDQISSPLVAITFSADSQQLYASADGGLVAMWQKQSKTKPANVEFNAFL